MNKKIKLLGIGIITFIIGLLIGITSTSIIYHNINNNQKNLEDSSISREESKYQDKDEYTLEELYSIVENPEQFYQLNDEKMSNYNNVMFHFYDYFPKDTKVKVTTSTQKQFGKVQKVLEVEYIDYKEYMTRMKDAYDYEERKKNEYKDSNQEEIYDYRLFVRDLVYGLK
ncbi:MAG: hypothetical protein ACI4XM_02435 [Candidatus Coprovivens sp.]